MRLERKTRGQEEKIQVSGFVVWFKFRGSRNGEMECVRWMDGWMDGWIGLHWVEESYLYGGDGGYLEQTEDAGYLSG